MVEKLRILLDEGIYSNFSELIRESIKNELLLDKGILEKKALLNKWFSEEASKGQDTSNLTQEELVKRIRKSRDSLWSEKYKGWSEEAI